MNFCQWRKSLADYVTDETYKKTRLEMKSDHNVSTFF